MENRNIIVIGASTGGVGALKRLVSLLPEDLPASVFIVMHISPTFRSRLDEILSEAGNLPAAIVQDDKAFKPGVIYIAPPNRHLLVKEERVITIFGPRENRARPSIDVLLRSAAAHHSTKVVAVLLTGNLNDGVSGLSAVKRCGGYAIVQDPAEAEAPELPRNAIEQVRVDRILSIEQIAAALSEITRKPAAQPIPIPEDIMEEVNMSEHEIPDMGEMNSIGDLTPYTCPECGGSLWNLKNEPIDRYICHTGHSYTLNAFLEGQAESIENSLWSAARFLQERADILKKMAASDRNQGRERSAEDNENKMKEFKNHSLIIRRLIMSGIFNRKP